MNEYYLKTIIKKPKLYFNSRHSNEEFKKSIEHITECIDVASKYGGRVFGGYVRNYLVPVLYKQECPGFKDVDLWFEYQEHADSFIRVMGIN